MLYFDALALQVDALALQVDALALQVDVSHSPPSIYSEGGDFKASRPLPNGRRQRGEVWRGLLMIAN
ncbi:MAG: hypothetical protein V7K14_28750 [Nostoc sp.]|uniref:hypothetical protein n=1 Tax=Nostoc sp. TaxID=1180 RepID=UPI002FF5E7A8